MSLFIYRQLRLGLDFITAAELAPAELIAAAAANGCQCVSLLVHSHPGAALRNHDLLDNPSVRRQARAAAHSHGVQIDLIEAFVIGPDTDIESFRPAFECGAFLEATFVNALVRDPDDARRLDNLGKYSELADACGLRPMLEPVASSSLSTFPIALDTIGRVGGGRLVLEVDVLQLIRTGGTPADLLAIDPDLIGRAQICDGPLRAAFEPRYEAVEQRQIPGEGEFPLREFLQALPRKEMTLAVEVPLRNLTDAGAGGVERIRLAVEGTRKIIESLE
jgi:sugar phosphate isomerase/epimerase